MKRNLVKSLLVLIIIPCVFMLVACGGDVLQLGQYETSATVQWGSDAEKEMLLDGMTETQFIEYYGGAEGQTCTFNEDGTLVLNADGDEAPVVIYYEASAGKVKIWHEAQKTGEPVMTLRIDGDQLISEIKMSDYVDNEELTTKLIITYTLIAE